MLKFFVRLFAVFIFLLPLFLFAPKGSNPPPVSAATCTFKAINTTGYLNEPVEVVITQANPFTNYTFTVNKGGNLVKSQVVGSGPIVVGGDVRYTFPGSNFSSSGNYVIFVSDPSGAACSGFPFTINLSSRPDTCTFKAINTTGYTFTPVEVVITQANPFLDYTFTVSKGGNIIKSQVVGSGPIVVGGDVRYTFPGSNFSSSGDYVIFVAAPGDFACGGFPFTINLSTNCAINVNFTEAVTNTNKPIWVLITGAQPFTDYQVEVAKEDGTVVYRQTKNSGPIVIDGEVRFDIPGSAFNEGGTYVFSAARLGGLACAGSPIRVPFIEIVSGKNPCEGGTCDTALGNISTQIGPFAQKILSIGIGLAGGIALIIMVIGSIRVLTSAGDPKNVAAGREMIIAAVAGLLFLIFSVLILQFIGFDILQIPNFG